MIEYIKIKPYGRVVKDRFDLSVKYKLLKQSGDYWLKTKKCIDNYQKFGEYLKGWIEKPVKGKQVQYQFLELTDKRIAEPYYQSKKYKRKQQIEEISLL